MLLCRWHLEVTNYALRKQKLCRKRDKPLIFVGKPRQLRTYLVATNLKKKRSNWGRTWQLQTWKKKENKLRFPSPSPTPEIMEEATATSFPGFSPTRFTERGREREGERGREGEREREREPGNEVEAAAEDVPFFHSSLLTRELIKPISRRWKKVPFFFYLYTALSGPK